MFNISIHLVSNDGAPMQVARVPSSVEEISLKDCEVDESMLVALFTSSPGLKSVVLRDNFIAVLEAIPAVSPLGNTLREYSQETLEILELDFKPNTPYRRPLGSLRHFSQLQRVSCGISMLLGSAWSPLTHDLGTVLPPSLTSLSLGMDHDWADGRSTTALVQLLEGKRETVPLLEQLHVKGFMKPAERERIQQACDAADVVLRLVFSVVAPPPLMMPLNELVQQWILPLADFEVVP
jgi:hypothetical protein